LDAPSGQIPSPPVRVLDAPSGQIPSPPVRVLDAPSGQIPSPPVRVLDAPSGQIPSPPVRFSSNSTVEVEMAAPSTADTFRLHSRPGSKRTLYLDFNGEVMSNNAWTANYNGGSNIVAAPYDSDGSPLTFSETERSKIILIWQRVAEDFIPFDVDVTTELTSEGQLTRSSSTDEYYGVRVLISPLTHIFGNYGGVSYVGTFNDIGDSWKPSLVFSDALGVNSDKNLAEAASHEAGHALGLSHDGVFNGSTYYSGNGTGETGWAPIMGVGYSKNVTQWSRGEYANANNTQDDLTVMQTYGIGQRTDDHGETNSVASYFAVGTQLVASGIIERNTDVDMFAFTAGAGPMVLTVSPQSPGPNLDLRAELRDASGVLVATSNPANSLSVSFNLNLLEGTYFLSLRGNGTGTPSTTGYSSYGSLGQYFIAGTVTAPVQGVAPVAVANSSTVTGTVPLAVTFDGSLSFDTDGSILGYAWDFGDGTGASEAVVNHSYLLAGSYTAVLTVTDNSGLTHTDSVIVVAADQNESPVANIAVSTGSGAMPLGVVFDASASVDPDGQLVSYDWDFGDGQTSQGISVEHTFLTAGTFQVTLRVTDDLGAFSLANTVIVVDAVEQRILRVDSIVTSTTKNVYGTTAWAAVRVTTPSGTPVSGVSVKGLWTGLASNGQTKVTDANGVALIASKAVKTSGLMNFSVTKLGLLKYIYDPSLNLQTTASIVISSP